MKGRLNLTTKARPTLRLRRPTTTTTQRPTTAIATSRRRTAKPQVSVRPFRKFPSRTTTLKPRESQAPPKPTKYTRTKLFPRRPTATTTRPLDDSHQESTQAEEATSLRDLAIALNILQHAPVPSESNKLALLEHPSTTLGSLPTGQRLQEWPQLGDDGGASRTRLKIAAPRTTSQPPSTGYPSNDPPATAAPHPHPTLYRVSSPSIPLLGPPSPDEAFYSAGASLPAHSKVLLHADGAIECLDQGSFPHPLSCRKFVSCSRTDSAKIVGWEYTCPRNLSFDPIGGMCNWSAGLGCDEK